MGRQRARARAPAPWQAARARARTRALAGMAQRSSAPRRALAGIARARTRALAGMRAPQAHPAPWQQRARAHTAPLRARQRAPLAVAKSTVLCLTSFFMNVESWPLLGQGCGEIHSPVPNIILHECGILGRSSVKLGVSICLHAIGIVGCGWPVGVDSSERDGVVRIGPCVAYLFQVHAGEHQWVDVIFSPSFLKLNRYSLFDGIYYSDNRSNSRANTCNKPRLLEGMHLLDKRSTQALPVALMIHDNSSDRTAFVPATHHSNFCPINFRCKARKLPNPDTEKSKKLVVGPWVGSIGPPLVCTGWLVPSAGDALLALTGRVVLLRCCYFEEIRVCDALRCSGPHARYTDVFNESIALADRPG
ncbi:hypothetical protein VNO78_35492 [Psophocarpus tetragonolobus]|uniref:Uncharacterized protein n=1 Tax=Psophocarpus tetragonolobus TaxID=3891 RepID=A0AAN9RR25_PSOTE